MGGSFAVGWMVATHGWRSVFLLMGVVGAALAVLMLYTLKEPVRGGAEARPAKADGPIPSLLEVLRHLAARRSAQLVAAGCVAVNLGMFGINLFIPAFLVRAQGLDMGTAGALFGLIAGISGIVGTLLGGVLADHLGRRDRRWYAWVPGLGALLATPLYLIAFSRPQLWQIITLMVVMSTLAQFWTGPTFAALHGMVRPRMRASTSALLLVLMAVLGNGLGPMLVGYLSDLLAHRAFSLTGGVADYASACTHLAQPTNAAAGCKAAGVIGIAQALSYAGWIFLLGAILYFAAARSLGADSRDNH